ncbi:MAG: tetratricopeptide repeat protein [Candidatus Pacebacteria bacterium]|nr:tetratricopeptide repeat protein [Candidatus Paceibacterota bacterium]
MAKQPEAHDRTRHMHRSPGQHPEEDPMAEMLEWFRAYWKHVLLGVLVVVAVVIAIWSSRAAKVARTEDGYAELSRAQSIEELRQVAREYGNSEPGMRAQLELGRQLFDAGRYSEAVESFETFEENYPENSLVSAARMGKGYSLEALGEFEDAMEAFAALAGDAERSAITAEAWLAGGRCAESAGLQEQARVYYENALSAGAGGGFSSRAEAALARLGGQSESGGGTDTQVR